MLNYYPSHAHIKNNYRHIGGQHAGIVESQLLLCNTQPAAPKLAICANQMPHYEQILVSDEAKINYHLSGYGIHREESLCQALRRKRRKICPPCRFMHVAGQGCLPFL